MSDDVLGFGFGVHDHQPIGNFDHVIAEATEAHVTTRLTVAPR